MTVARFSAVSSHSKSYWPIPDLCGVRDKSFTVVLITLILSLNAFAQSELGTSAIRMIPRQADTDTGVIRWYEWTANGTSRIDLKGQTSLEANKVLRLPGETSTLVARDNHVYGSDSFIISGYKARGTAASPSNVGAGDVLFQFMGLARSGGSEVNAGSLTFAVDAVSPSLDTSINFGLTVGGSYGTRFGMDKASFYGVGRPTLGLSSAAGRWGTLYGDSADFLVPTGSSPQYSTGSFIRAQTLELYDSAGYSGGFKWQTTNTPAGSSYLELLDASAAPVWRFNRVSLSGSPITEVTSYMSIIPATTTTYDLGDTSHRWNKIWADKLDLGTGGFTSNASPYVTGAVDLGSSLLEWNKLYVHDIEMTGTCTGCPSGSGAAPLSEAIITDYGAAADCSASINTAYTSAKAALTGGGHVTFPPGCYLINASLIIGNSAGTSESTEETIYLVGAGAAYNPSGLASNTEIRWDSGTVPGSVTPMIQFSGPINAGGIKGILLNANNTANVYYVNQRHHAYGTFQNVWAKRAPTSPSWIVTTSSTTYPYGSCYNRYDQLHITNDSVSGGGGMYLTGATGSGRDTCSNLFTDGEIWYDSDASGTYGVKLDYADNNTFLRFNLFRTSNGPGALESSYSSGSAWAVSCNTSTEYCTLGASNSAIANGARVRFSYGPSGSLPTGIQWALPYFVINKSGNTFQVSLTSGGSAVDITAAGSNVIVFLVNPGVLLERYSGDDSFPKENAWYSSAIHNGVWSPNPPTGGNDFPEFQPDDCYVSPCIPNLDYVWGKAKGQMLGSGNTPPGVAVNHADNQNTFRIYQGSGLSNGSGSIVFQHPDSGTVKDFGRIRSHYFDGMVFSTAASGGALAERWKITDAGHWYPASDATYSIGNVSNRTDQIWAREYRAYTNNAFGAQNHTLYGDNNVNLNLKSYGSAGNDYRPGINFYRAEGTAASPSPIATNDRLGVFAWWYNTGSGSESMSVAARLNVVADSYSAGVAATSIRFATMDLGGSLADRFTINPSGAATFSSTIDATTINATGSPAYRVSGTTVINASRDIFGAAITSTTTEASTALYVITSAVTRFSASGGGVNVYNSGGSNVFSIAASTGNVTFTGAITAPSGSAGVSVSGNCPAGEAVKGMAVSAGIVTSITCGVP